MFSTWQGIVIKLIYLYAVLPRIRIIVFILLNFMKVYFENKFASGDGRNSSLMTNTFLPLCYFVCWGWSCKSDKKCKNLLLAVKR